MSRWFIAGGAGFIGSHFTDRLLGDSPTARVTIYDNFSSGRRWHYEHHVDDSRLRVVTADLNDSAALQDAIAGHDTVLHLASNPDIARAVADPDVDFREGTVLTRQIVEAMRATGVRRLLFASGSGVYGDIGAVEGVEDRGPMVPISPYAASKIAGEALIAAYCHLFEFRACVFRFGNVVGPRQTHGVGFNFLRDLTANPQSLSILGDGSQSKSYIHIDDIVAAVLCAHDNAAGSFEAYNVATGDYITLTEVARIAVETMGLDPAAVRFEYAGGDRGWKGDVPIVRLNTDRIRALGWTCARTTEQALRDSMHALLADGRRGRLW